MVKEDINFINSTAKTGNEFTKGPTQYRNIDFEIV